MILKKSGFGTGIDFEKFGIRDWDLGWILENSGFGMEFGKFGIWDWDLGFSFKNAGLGANHFGIGMGLGSRKPTSANDCL